MDSTCSFNSNFCYICFCCCIWYCFYLALVIKEKVGITSAYFSPIFLSHNLVCFPEGLIPTNSATLWFRQTFCLLLQVSLCWILWLSIILVMYTTGTQVQVEVYSYLYFHRSFCTTTCSFILRFWNIYYTYKMVIWTALLP